MSRYQFLCDAQEAASNTQSNDISIVILPPSAGNQDIDSDEENDDDVLDKDYMPEEVSGELEVHIESEHSDCEEEQRTNTPGRERKWRKKEEVCLGAHSQPSKIAGDFAGKDIYDIFEQFFTDEMIEHIVEQTNLYAVRDKNCKNFNVDGDEIRKFLGLLLISGYHNVPSENDYWSTSEDLEIPIFHKTMSRDTFRTLKRYMHIADNSNLAESKVAKVFPLLEMLRERCQVTGTFHEYLSIDESMIPYHGHHSAKQFIRNKPVRFGYKMWMLCSADGYPYNFELYCGKDDKRALPLGTHVVMNMLRPVKNRDEHVVFFDNFFTSYDLLSELARQNTRACGTVRENRTKKCPLISKKEMEKKDRGTFDYRSDGSILCTRWHDNNIVTVASNYYGVTPLQKCERNVKKVGKTPVSQPYLISMYNKGMGGVDVCDRMLSSYRPRLRSKKWWWNIFSHMLNLSVVAAYRFYKYVNPTTKVQHKDFRREIARTLVKVHTKRKRQGGPSVPPPKAIRYDNVNHFLESAAQGRCCVCQKNTRLQCIKCEKRLHKVCSDIYHKK